MNQDSARRLQEAALTYHKAGKSGKLEITATKPLSTQHDLALAYSPGVAAPCLEIAENPAKANDYTARGNLIAVVSNGTAVLGLGAIGPLAAKPVMEGKAVLFKKFSGIDVFDIEIDAPTVEQVCTVVRALEPTFGGINLEDIKAPECFEIEEQLRAQMKIPVFHDDQHGTAIVVAAAILNGLRLVGKEPGEVRVACAGAGAAAIASLNLLVGLGIPREHIFVADIEGVVYEGRESLMDRWKAVYARPTEKRRLQEIVEGADIFLGLSAPNILKPEWLATMAKDPIVMALANPSPEIMPDLAKEVRPDALIATGRSDFPNQVNNVLVFPFIFRGALDVGATKINEEMKLAAVKAVADLAMVEQSDVVLKAYGGQPEAFGPEYLIPRPFDPRLMLRIAPAVAKAAMDTGVAERPIADWESYRMKLESFVYRTGLVMRPVFEAAQQRQARVAYTNGEDDRVLRAAQMALDQGLAKPILIGRPAVIDVRVRRLGLRFRPDRDVEVINPESDHRFNAYWQRYHEIAERRGVTPERAKTLVRTDTTVIGALAVDLGDADAVLAGPEGDYRQTLQQIRKIIGLAEDTEDYSALTLLILPNDSIFIADTNVTVDPSCSELVHMTTMAAEQVRRFGMTPKVALLSYGNFGSADSPSARKMHDAVAQLHKEVPELAVEGEMQADAALDEVVRQRLFPNAHYEGAANLLIMPSLDAANIAMNLARTLGRGLQVGPILLGSAKPAHILVPSVTPRGIVNMTALAAADCALPDKAADDVAEQAS